MTALSDSLPHPTPSPTLQLCCRVTTTPIKQIGADVSDGPVPCSLHTFPSEADTPFVTLLKCLEMIEQ